MAVVVGLILGSIVTGAALYRHGVRCRVAARQPGLAVLSDGHDTGARTSEGADRAAPAAGAPRDVAARAGQRRRSPIARCRSSAGQLCEVSFTEPASR